jgi:hypothetical protein
MLDLTVADAEALLLMGDVSMTFLSGDHLESTAAGMTRLELDCTPEEAKNVDEEASAEAPPDEGCGDTAGVVWPPVADDDVDNLASRFRRICVDWYEH